MVARQPGIGRGDVGHLFRTRQHQIGDRAGDERLIGLYQHHIDFVVGQQAHIFGCRGTAVTAAYHHDFGPRRDGCTGTGGEAQQAECCSRLQEGAALEIVAHGAFPISFALRSTPPSSLSGRR